MSGDDGPWASEKEEVKIKKVSIIDIIDYWEWKLMT